MTQLGRRGSARCHLLPHDIPHDPYDLDLHDLPRDLLPHDQKETTGV